jgi:hypothetical protein
MTAQPFVYSAWHASSSATRLAVLNPSPGEQIARGASASVEAACVSLTRLIYMSEVGVLTIKAKLPLNLLELFAIFITRTLINPADHRPDGALDRWLKPSGGPSALGPPCANPACAKESL